MDDPNKLNTAPTKKVNPRENASFFSKLFFWWSLPIFFKGMRKTLMADDLYATLKVHESKTLGNRLEIEWDKEVAKSTNPSLWKPLIKIFWKEVAMYGILFLFLEVIVKMAQPLFLAGLMGYYEPGQTTISKKQAHYYAGGLISASFVSVLLTHNYFLGLQTAAMKIRISCCALVYRKALKISQSALAENTVGKMINIIANDVGRFDYTLIHLHNFWVAPIESSIVMYLLYTNLGATALAGVAVLLAFIPIQSFMGKMTSVYRMRTALKTDKRVRLMNEIITGIQVIKMYTWEKPFSILVDLARKSEIHQIKSVSYLRAINFSFILFLNRAALYLCILTYVVTGHVLKAQYVYVATSFYGMIRNALTLSLPFGITYLAETNVSVKRIRKFLIAEEITSKNQTADEGSENVGIKMKNISTKWVQSSEEPSLQEINFEASTGKLIGVIGTVGSGKSTLFQVILKELPVIDGSLEVEGRISYASQEPWIFAGSIRENILFGGEYDQKRYREVTRVCSLERDFSLFPYADRTIVGDRGTMLSGGQKARINLARAVYKEADIYLLDDPLSAVDTHVGKQLFDDCINGYLKDKCTILITHQLQYLRNVERIYLMENGRIGGTGTYAELHNERRDFLQRLLSEQPKDTPNELEEESEELIRTQSIGKKEEQPVALKEEQTTGSISSKVYAKYLKSGGGYFAAITLFSIFVITQLAASSLDYFLTVWVNLEQDRAEKNETHFEKLNTNITELNDTDPTIIETDLRLSFLTPYNCLYIHSTLLAIVIILSLTRSMSFFTFAMRASRRLHNEMFSKIVYSSMRFFNTNPAGRILNRFSKDIGSVDEIIPQTLIDTVQFILNILAISLVIGSVNPWILIPTVIIFGIFYGYRMIFLATSRDVKRIEGITRSPIFSHMTTSLHGLTTIRAFNAQDNLKKQFDYNQDLNSSAFYTFLASSRTFSMWLDSTSICYLSIVVFSFLLVGTETYGGNVGLAITQSLSLTGMLQYVMRQWSELENQMTSVERVVEYTQIAPEEDKGKILPPKSWPSEGAIKFEDVSMKYSEDEAFVLKNLSFSIAPCEKIGIVGRTGAGKSSLISAFFRLAHIEGKIIIDGIDSQDISLECLRSKISIIPQEPVLFSGNLRKNLDPFDQYDDKELWDALEEVELKSTISDLPAGLHCTVTEGGSNFSVGQRQLLCLARAIMRSNKILVLDEATANVDPKTDLLIQTTIRKKFQNCTVLTIAHRLHTIIDSDKILVMDAGRGEEFGHPHELLQNTEGVFYGLVQQTGKFMSKNLITKAAEVYSEKKTS